MASAWLLLAIPCLILLGTLPVAGEEPGKTPDQYIAVEVKGKLKAGIVAIGGETTGYLIVAKGVTWELDFGSNQELKKLADSLDGKIVIVKGNYEVRAGVEIKQRHIVTVKGLEAAK